MGCLLFYLCMNLSAVVMVAVFTTAAAAVIAVVSDGGIDLPLTAAACVASTVHTAAIIERNSCLASAGTAAAITVIRSSAPEASAYSLIHSEMTPLRSLFRPPKRRLNSLYAYIFGRCR